MATPTHPLSRSAHDLRGTRFQRPAEPTLELSAVVHIKAHGAATAGVPVADLATRSPFATVNETQHRRSNRATRREIHLVEDHAADFHIAVTQVDYNTRTVGLRGTVAAFEAAFGLTMGVYRHWNEGEFVAHPGEIMLPEDLVGIVESITGLHSRTIHFKLPQTQGGIGSPMTTATWSRPAGSFYPQEVAKAYDFPTGTGKGQSVAIVELGGGFTQATLNTYFQAQGLPTPKVRSVSVHGSANQPGGSADAEVYLDICVIGCICPEATIVVYFAPDYATGIKAAASSTTYAHAAISVSWGSQEVGYYGTESNGTVTLTSAGQSVQAALEYAAGAQIPVFISSGDNGSGNSRTTDGKTWLTKWANVSFPASSPHAIACGGTSLRVDATGAVQSEVVWNNVQSQEGSSSFVAGAQLSGGATGGGVSRIFAAPRYQSTAGIHPTSRNPSSYGPSTGRGLPDVSGNADGNTGYLIAYPGYTDPITVGGTSAVAPLWAALTVLLNEGLAPKNKRLGSMFSLLYSAKGRATFRDIGAGNNDTSPGVGGYAAATGWDACTGLGSPDGAALAAYLDSLIPTG